MSSDEYLNYAEKNRQEWEDKGIEVVAQMMEALKAEEKLNKYITSGLSDPSKTTESQQPPHSGLAPRGLSDSLKQQSLSSLTA